MLGVVYTNGFFRVFNISSASILVEVSLLADLDDEFDRVVEAQINFRTHLSVVDENVSVSKSISLGVAFTAECSRRSTKQSGLQTFSLKFQSFILEDTHAYERKEEERKEELIDLGRDASLIHVH